MAVFLTRNVTFFTDEAWFHLNGHIIVESSRYWSAIHPLQTFEVSLQDQKTAVWCAITATRTVGPDFLKHCLKAEERHFEHLT
jgi:hypothetical protein